MLPTQGSNAVSKQLHAKRHGPARHHGGRGAVTVEEHLDYDGSIESHAQRDISPVWSLNLYQFWVGAVDYAWSGKHCELSRIGLKDKGRRQRDANLGGEEAVARMGFCGKHGSGHSPRVHARGDAREREGGAYLSYVDI